MPPVAAKSQQAIETTWLQQIVGIGGQEQGDMIILTFMLANGHQYCVPLDKAKQEGIRKIISPVPVFSAKDIPRNGHGS